MIRSRSPIQRQARGFTLVEIIVVLIVLAVVAGVALPRFAGNPSRQAQAEAEQVRSLVAQVAAQLARPGRDGARSIAIEYVAEGSMLRIAEPDPSAQTGAGAGGGRAERRWRVQRLTPVVSLDRLRVIQATADGVILPVRASSDWKIELSHTALVPRLSLVLAAEAASPNALHDAWQVDLDPDSMRASLRQLPDGSRAAATLESGAVNLDTTGGTDLPW